MNPPPPEKKPAAKPETQAGVIPTGTPPHGPDSPLGRGAGIAPAVAPTAPPGYTQNRTITIAGYSATGKAPIYILTEGSYSAFHSGAENVSADVKNRLSPPPAAAGTG
jgi:hypothetical protein